MESWSENMQSKMQEDIRQAVSTNKNKNVLWGYYDICGMYVLLMEKEMATHPVFLPGESHEQRILVGYSPQSRRVGHDWVT